MSTTTQYVAVPKDLDGPIYGIGPTPQTALADAEHYTDADSGTRGDLITREASPDLAGVVQAQGGNVEYAPCLGDPDKILGVAGTCETLDDPTEDVPHVTDCHCETTATYSDPIWSIARSPKDRMKSVRTVRGVRMNIDKRAGRSHPTKHTTTATTPGPTLLLRAIVFGLPLLLIFAGASGANLARHYHCWAEDAVGHRCAMAYAPVHLEIIWGVGLLAVAVGMIMLGYVAYQIICRRVIPHERAVTPVLGVLLLMPTMIIGLVAVHGYMAAQADWANAEAEKARFMAECARAWASERVEPDPGCPGVEDDPGSGGSGDLEVPGPSDGEIING